MEVDVAWNLSPGTKIVRVKLHDQFGGARYGGISPSRREPAVMIFSDPASGRRHGYIDDWKPDGRFHYTGEGQHGDQQMVKGNKAILQHERDGRSLRLFDGTKGTVTYVGEFMIDPEEPYYHTDAPETNGGPLRQVIMFRLVPIDTQPQAPESEESRSSAPTVSCVPVEQQHSETATISPTSKERVSTRREQTLLLEFVEFLEAGGSRAERLKITPPGEARSLYTDLYDPKRGILYEAKGSVAREAIRMLIGQLADYRRFVDPMPAVAALLPERPREDLLELLQREGIAVVYRDSSEGFVELPAD